MKWQLDIWCCQCLWLFSPIMPFLIFSYPFVLISFSLILYEMLTSSCFLNLSPHVCSRTYPTLPALLLLSCWFSDLVVHYCPRNPSFAALPCMPLAYRPTHPNSLAPLSPFIPLSSSSSVRGTAEFFIKQTSSICQSPGQTWRDWFFCPPASFVMTNCQLFYCPHCLPSVSPVTAASRG